MSELDKLEQYLKENGIGYNRIDEQRAWNPWPRHQIIVFGQDGGIAWDAICHRGSYGFEQGLLEIYGNIVTEEDGDSFVGRLTAEDVIKRIQPRS